MHPTLLGTHGLPSTLSPVDPGSLSSSSVSHQIWQPASPILFETVDLVVKPDQHRKEGGKEAVDAYKHCTMRINNVAAGLQDDVGVAGTHDNRVPSGQEDQLFLQRAFAFLFLVKPVLHQFQFLLHLKLHHLRLETGTGLEFRLVALFLHHRLALGA